MSALQACHIKEAYHYTPIHYLVFIARAHALKSKPALEAEGYLHTHFRSKSKHLDNKRGFGDFIHMTLAPFPNILRAKLTAGFPHVKIHVPTTTIEKVDYLLCRYNIAMTRYIRKNGQGGFPPSETNGRYYGTMQVPVAIEEADKKIMLRHHLKKGTMIEVLVKEKLPLPVDVTVTSYSEQDSDIIRHIFDETQCPWQISHETATCYSRKDQYVQSVNNFIDKALSDASWRGDGLEFDKI